MKSLPQKQLLDSLLTLENTNTDNTENASPEDIDWFRILVVGAGALGSEILKCLLCTGFRSIDIIDMDTVELTNLNRQFLFRKETVGLPKASVAAAFAKSRYPTAKIQEHVGRIEDKPDSFYSEFSLIIAGLDSIEARRYLNFVVHKNVKHDSSGTPLESSIVPLLDGGTEGFRGQSRIIMPTKTHCFECTIDTFPPQVNYPICTISETPRLPEHCIEYARIVLWERERSAEALDLDDLQHLQWIHQKALIRAEAFGIVGVTYSLTIGVLKRIIPAVASMNAMIGASLVNEAFKLATSHGRILDTYMMVIGDQGLFTHTFDFEKKPNCLVCQRRFLVIRCHPSDTIASFIQTLKDDTQFRFQNPSISSSSGEAVFMGSRFLRNQFEENLKLTVSHFIDPGATEAPCFHVTDPSIEAGVVVNLIFLN